MKTTKKKYKEELTEEEKTKLHSYLEEIGLRPKYWYGWTRPENYGRLSCYKEEEMSDFEVYLWTLGFTFLMIGVGFAMGYLVRGVLR